MDAELAIKKWAGKKIGVKPENITRVDFGTRQEGYCSTCEYTVSGVEVTYKKGNSNSGRDFISLDFTSFTDVLAEVLAEG